jgi:hypothetical protein
MGSMSYFRPEKKGVRLNGFLVVVVLGAFIVGLIALAVCDAWLRWGPR